MIQRAFRYRTYPTPEQANWLAQMAGATRLVYNLALEQRRTFGRRGRSFNFASQGPQLTLLRRELDWLGALPAGPMHQALRDLDKAFGAYFSGTARYPTPRKRALNDSFRFQALHVKVKRLNRKWSAIRAPGLGWVKFRDTRPTKGNLVNATFARDGLGWHISLACAIEHTVEPSTLPAIGIDRGVANTVALSTGEMLSTPSTEALDRRKKRAQRILARRVRGSNRYRKQRQRLSRITAKITRVRANWRHKVTTDLARRFGTVVLEDLKIPAMTAAGKGKRGLNRSILEQGWGAFERILAYKLEERGGSIVKVNPAYSSQTCSACGTVDRKARESQARFSCRACGSEMHADHNAALVILRRSTPSMSVEVADCGTVEAGTATWAIAA